MNTPLLPHILTTLFVIPLLAAIFIAIMPAKLARYISISSFVVMLAVSLVIALGFNYNLMGMQFSEVYNWITMPFKVQYHVGVDGISLCLVILSTFIFLFSALASYSIGDNRPKFYYANLMLLSFSVIGVFISLDLLQFFVMYEFELVPMYFLIAIWGGPGRSYAAMKFLIYTFTGGVFMLTGLIYMYTQLGVDNVSSQTFDMIRLAQICPLMPQAFQTMACLGFLMAFLIKLPSFPFHTWLPDAHVEAPTPISMILAGLLLKMGSYGLVRICLGFFPYFFLHYGPVLMFIGAFNIVWAAIACMVQTDMKRIIAFSSVSHMGFVTLGISAVSAAALSGAIFQMISHGVISALLFFLVGVVYERTHTRDIHEIGGGLTKLAPVLFYFWMFACMANLGLPGLSGFVAETAVIYGSFTGFMATVGKHAHMCQWSVYLAATGMILTAGYMLWLLKRLFYGDTKEKWINHFAAIRPLEQFIAYGLAIMVLALGIYPMLITKEYVVTSDAMNLSIMQRATIGCLDHNHKIEISKINLPQKLNSAN